MLFRSGRNPTSSAHSSATARRAIVAIGLATIALLHLLDLPGKFEDGPAYLAWSYVGLIVAAATVTGIET